MKDLQKAPAADATAQSSGSEDEAWTVQQPSDVNAGHGIEALQEASERMLLRNDRT